MARFNPVFTGIYNRLLPSHRRSHCGQHQPIIEHPLSLCFEVLSKIPEPNFRPNVLQRHRPPAGWGCRRERDRNCLAASFSLSLGPLTSKIAGLNEGYVRLSPHSLKLFPPRTDTEVDPIIQATIGRWCGGSLPRIAVHCCAVVMLI